MGIGGIGSGDGDGISRGVGVCSMDSFLMMPSQPSVVQRTSQARGMRARALKRGVCINDYVGQRTFKPSSNKPASKSPEVSPATMATATLDDADIGIYRTMPRCGDACSKKPSIMATSSDESGY